MSVNAKKCKGSATLIAREIRHRIKSTIGITVSAGIAPNKFIAKIASDWNKPDGQTVITPDQITDFMADLPVKHIWGVGKVTEKKLEQFGIKTCADVRNTDIFEFVQRFGQFGEHIHRLAHGIDERPVVSEWRRKSVSVENTYAEDLADLDSCITKLPQLLESLELRVSQLDNDYQLQNCFLKMKFHDFCQTTVERQKATLELNSLRELCEEAWLRGEKPVRLIGIGIKLNDLTNASKQMDLFDTPH